MCSSAGSVQSSDVALELSDKRFELGNSFFRYNAGLCPKINVRFHFILPEWWMLKDQRQNRFHSNWFWFGLGKVGVALKESIRFRLNWRQVRRMITGSGMHFGIDNVASTV